MLLKEVMDIFSLLDKPTISGKEVVEYFKVYSPDEISSTTISTEKGSTDFIKIVIEGKKGKRNGGSSPTLGIVGRLGGIGARPKIIGTVSDADGAIAAFSVALKVCDMKIKGDQLDGDLIITTHVCANAPTQPHFPVPFMRSPVDMQIMNTYEISKECDAFLSIDTTKGNKIINHKGFAISPTMKEGYILKVADNLLDIMQIVTGDFPQVFAISTQDINGLHHLNSILQPCIATQAPVVGVAIKTAVPGCATGASNPIDIESAARFSLEVAKYFGNLTCSFYDENEYSILIERYGSFNILQTLGKK